MPKRNRSNSEDYIQQSKIYVNEQIVEKNDTEKMQNVYDKTMNLLFNGAKSKPKTDVLSNKNTMHNTLTLNNNFRQMFLSKDGKLQDTGVIKSPKSNKCKTCISDPVACKFCDDLQCFNCGVFCKKCEEFFCKNCSLNLYEETDGHICLTCA